MCTSLCLNRGLSDRQFWRPILTVKPHMEGCLPGVWPSCALSHSCPAQASGATCCAASQAAPCGACGQPRCSGLLWARSGSLPKCCKCLCRQCLTTPHSAAHHTCNHTSRGFIISRLCIVPSVDTPCNTLCNPLHCNSCRLAHPYSLINVRCVLPTCCRAPRPRSFHCRPLKHAAAAAR